MLQDWHIVIMRARHQANELARAFEAHRATIHIVPLINIIPIDPSPHIKMWQHEFRTADMLIVTSANAVLCAPLDLLNVLNPKAFILTMGQSSTMALKEKQADLMVSYTAAHGATSESVLAETFLQTAHIFKKKIVILAGEGGRTVLADTLSARGADVHWTKVYRQQKPVLDMDDINAHLQKSKKVCFVATSSSIVENLLSLTVASRAWLLEQSLVVVSERILYQAKAWGFKRVFLAKGAHTQAIINACAEISLDLS